MKEVISTSFFNQSEQQAYLYAILPTLLRSRELLNILQAHPHFALTLEKFAYRSKTFNREVPSVFHVQEMGQIWLQTRIPSLYTEHEEKRQLEHLAHYISRLFTRLEKRFHRHPYRSFEQTIYGLLDPRTDVMRYVGMAHDLRRRYRRHLENREGTIQKKAWLTKLHNEHIEPELVILERGPETSYRAEEREFRWIRYFLRQGSLLTNVEGSYKHLIQTCQSVDIDMLVEPLTLWEPSPPWWLILEAQAHDEMERFPSSKKTNK